MLRQKEEIRRILCNNADMKRGTVAYTLFGLALPGFYFWNFQFPLPSDDRDSMAAWQPDAAAIKKSLNARFDGKIHLNNAAAREMFVQAFQQRYREHTPQLAVGLKLHPTRHIRLLLPSRMEPWHINRIALTAFREVHDVFGGDTPVDIYETFVGAAPICIGQVAVEPDNPQQIRVTFDYSRSPNSAAKRP